MLKHILFDPDDIARAKLGGPDMPGNLVPYIFKILPSDCNELPGKATWKTRHFFWK